MGLDINIVGGVDSEAGEVGGGPGDGLLGPVVGVGYAVAKGVAGY